MHLENINVLIKKSKEHKSNNTETNLHQLEFSNPCVELLPHMHILKGNITRSLHQPVSVHHH